MIRLAVLAVPGCLASAVYGIAEITALANSLVDQPLFSTMVFTVDGEPVSSYTGNRILPDGSLEQCRPDMMILPPIIADLDEVLNMDEIGEWLIRHHGAGRQSAAVCAGAFLLAETGLLDGRDATTHWNLAERFRRRYPGVNLQAERLLVDSGDYICCGGVTAWMDLALYLVSRHAGKEISRQCAKMMLMDPHREYQTPYGMGGFRKNHGDAAVLRAQTWIEQHYADPFGIREIAAASSLGERTLLRRFREAVGQTPGRYVQRVRVEAAQGLLETTDKSVEEVAGVVGYTDYSAFRKLFKRLVGCTPSVYRQRFGILKQVRNI